MVIQFVKTYLYMVLNTKSGRQIIIVQGYYLNFYLKEQKCLDIIVVCSEYLHKRKLQLEQYFSGMYLIVILSRLVLVFIIPLNKKKTMILLLLVGKIWAKWLE